MRLHRKAGMSVRREHCDEAHDATDHEEPANLTVDDDGCHRRCSDAKDVMIMPWNRNSRQCSLSASLMAFCSRRGRD